jgi:hypothetical protein
LAKTYPFTWPSRRITRGQLEELRGNLEDSADGIPSQSKNEDEPSRHDENEAVIVPIIRTDPKRGLEDSE